MSLSDAITNPCIFNSFFDLWRADIINLAVVEATKKSIITSLKNQFIVLWSLLTQNQKKALCLVAEREDKGIYTEELYSNGLGSIQLLSCKGRYPH